MKKNIIIISSVDWNDNYQMHHQLTESFEKEGSNYSIKGELYEVDKDDLRNANRIELGAGYEFKEIDKDVWGYVYPKKIDSKSLNIITNKDKKYYEWRNFNDMRDL